MGARCSINTTVYKGMHYRTVYSKKTYGYQPVAHTPAISKCFEQLVLTHIKDTVIADPEQYQFAYRATRSPMDAICMALNTELSHLERHNTYARILFFDCLAFSTVILSKPSFICNTHTLYALFTHECQTAKLHTGRRFRT